MEISFIIPSRNNLKYLEWAYNSIRKNQGNHKVQICVADDASEDGTWDWCKKKMADDKQFNAIQNKGPERLGLVILNDKLVNEVAKYDACIVYHADMYLCPGALDSIEHYLKEKTIVSLTRIEPSLHPPGPEKVLLDSGIEPEEFDEEQLLVQLDRLKTKDKTTEGIFAPWAFWKKDFQEIGGHDPIFAPQSKEDSDIFNRFHLNGVEFVQTWEGFVYHMTSRGSRFNTFSGGAPGKNSEEWLYTTTKNERNFIRKWGTSIQHDSLMKPIVSPKYKIGFKIKNCNEDILRFLEPWCDHTFVDCNFTNYLLKEKSHTTYNLTSRVLDYNESCHDNIIVEINALQFTRQDYETVSKLSDILHDSGDIGEFELGNLKITINSLETYENKLICIY